MPRFAANLSMLFTEVDFPERFAMARAAGFEGVEYLFPYAYPKDLLKDLLNDNKLSQVLFNLPPGDWDAGERGSPACRTGWRSSRPAWIRRSTMPKPWAVGG